jgi:hypothetical protein
MLTLETAVAGLKYDLDGTVSAVESLHQAPRH